MSRCPSRGVLWASVEHVDFQCSLQEGHADRHFDETFFLSWYNDPEDPTDCDYDTLEWEEHY